MKRLRRFLLEGIALVVPVSATMWALWWLFTRLDRILGGYFESLLGRSFPGLGLVALLLLLLVTGFLTERALGRRMTLIWEWIVDHVPVARPVYRGSRRVVGSLVGQDAEAFKKAVLCEYPTPGTWAVAFLTGPAPADAHDLVGSDAVTVFLPTAPNPMSGFLLVVPKDKVYELPVPPEEAFTFVLSMGAVPLGEVVPDAGLISASREPPARRTDAGPHDGGAP
jgi:uncharacterized membrane protein